MRKAAPYILLLVLAIITFFISRWKKNQDNEAPKTETVQKKSNNSSAGNVKRNRGFDRRISYIEYTQHAKCRMRCRYITQKEVQEIMQEGKINYAKSDLNDKPCPTYALEGTTDDDQRVRIVFAQCDHKSKVVTVIDLQTDFECHCPGDDNKYKNRN